MSKSINQVWQKIKAFTHEMKEELVVILIIILVSVSSFTLGKISVKVPQREGVRIISASGDSLRSKSDTSQTQTAEVANASSEGTVVASKNGSKYHYTWCPGAKQISEKNKITFASIDEARKVGYTPAANCKGLK